MEAPIPKRNQFSDHQLYTVVRTNREFEVFIAFDNFKVPSVSRMECDSGLEFNYGLFNCRDCPVYKRSQNS